VGCSRTSRAHIPTPEDGQIESHWRRPHLTLGAASVELWAISPISCRGVTLLLRRRGSAFHNRRSNFLACPELGHLAL
jgi:hypothetical protein